MKKVKSELPLREFWLSLGKEAGTPRLGQRLGAQRMRLICENANLNYEGLRLIMLNHRRLSMPAAKRLHTAAKKWSDNNGFHSIISMDDLISIACREEIRDTRKTHIGKY